MLDHYRNSQQATPRLAVRQSWNWKISHVFPITNSEEPPPQKGKSGKCKNSKGRNLLNCLLNHRSFGLLLPLSKASRSPTIRPNSIFNAWKPNRRWPQIFRPLKERSILHVSNRLHQYFANIKWTCSRIWLTLLIENLSFFRLVSFLQL